jgi:ferrous iron transport protein B
LVDLPGTYGYTPHSDDERVTHNVLKGKLAGVRRPDAILLTLDSTNLSRNLAMAAPVLALGIPTLVLLNMADDLRRRGGVLDTEALATQLGAPVALVSAARGEGLTAVCEFLKGSLAAPAPLELPVIQDAPRCRQWARQIGEHASYRPPAPPEWTRRLDAVFLHPVKGPLVLMGAVVLAFQAMFTAARPFMSLVQWALSSSGSLLEGLIPDSPLRSLLLEGVWSGVGSVLVFLPQILLLFLVITVLEESGYLARAALIADRTMARVGLQGKSLIPLLAAHACAVPAVLAARTISNQRDRMATILVMPFVTCSARLPVYTLIIAAFMPERPLLGPILGTRAAALLGLYLLGYLAALATARLLKSSVLRSQREPFIMELPPYRWPSWQSLWHSLLDRTLIFLKRAGTVILVAVVALWCLAHLPLHEGRAPALQDSLAGTLGRTIEPVIRPLGFDWRIGVGLVSSLAAREMIVSTLGTLYGMDPETQSAGLQAALRRELTPGGAAALLVFFAFAMQCASTIAAVRQETGGWRWPLLQFAYMGSLAYIAAFVANHVTRLMLG